MGDGMQFPANQVGGCLSSKYLMEVIPKLCETSPVQHNLHVVPVN